MRTPTTSLKTSIKTITNLSDTNCLEIQGASLHGQKGEIRKRYTDGQEDQLGTLGLVTNAVVLWNTIYMQAALDHLRAQGETLNDEDIARLSPLCHGHINMLGHYSFTLAELVTKGHLRPLKEASEAENVA
ncbi:Tn3 family transposase [Enterobacter hormaechei]|nr:Tn3 family transposase [Enterobacter hormaechei]MEC5918016.1 Tn3 family transposase [Enterobacter hormaechei]